MSSKKMKRELQTSVRLDNDLLEWITTIKELMNLSSTSEAVRLTFQKAYPDIEEIVAKLRERKDELRGIIDDENKPDV